ncbi:MAG: hypothetical protein KDA58_11225 [Planctomycetaceae bacterium]|nr:hypothetical protein [Planctomycetaceae bacterium]
MSRSKGLVGLVLFGLVLGWMCLLPPAPVAQGQPPASESIDDFMHQKLVHSQKVLQGLVTNDFAAIRKGAGALKQTSLDAPKPKGDDPLDLELYEHFKLEFLRLTTQLGEMADEQNIEGAAFVYQNLTANCMACHQFLEANGVRNAN